MNDSVATTEKKFRRHNFMEQIWENIEYGRIGGITEYTAAKKL